MENENMSVEMEKENTRIREIVAGIITGVEFAVEHSEEAPWFEGAHVCINDKTAMLKFVKEDATVMTIAISFDYHLEEPSDPAA